MRVRFPPSPTGNLHVGMCVARYSIGFSPGTMVGNSYFWWRIPAVGLNLEESYQVLYYLLTWVMFYLG